jgi:hypothetical protein
VGGPSGVCDGDAACILDGFQWYPPLGRNTEWIPSAIWRESLSKLNQLLDASDVSEVVNQGPPQSVDQSGPESTNHSPRGEDV